MININLVLVIAVTRPGRYFHAWSGTTVYVAGYHAQMYISVLNEGFDGAKCESSDVSIRMTCKGHSVNDHPLWVIYVCADFWKSIVLHHTVHCVSTQLLRQSYRQEPISYSALTVLQESSPLHVWRYRLKDYCVYFIICWFPNCGLHSNLVGHLQQCLTGLWSAADPVLWRGSIRDCVLWPQCSTTASANLCDP